jgi:hypothetical protein
MRRLNPLLFLLLVIIGVKLSEELYRWAAFREERVQVKTLRDSLVEAGAEIVRTREGSDSMRAVMTGEDAELERELRALRRYNRLARGGSLPADLYARYREELDRHNLHVTERNARLRDWQRILARNHAAVDRYNVLADSIRELATRMGDPYYAVPTPAEAAMERGLIKPEPATPPAPR